MKANTDRALRGQIGADRFRPRAYICRWCSGSASGSDQTGISIDLLSRAFGPKESSSPSLLCSTSTVRTRRSECMEGKRQPRPIKIRETTTTTKTKGSWHATTVLATRHEIEDRLRGFSDFRGRSRARRRRQTDQRTRPLISCRCRAAACRPAGNLRAHSLPNPSILASAPIHLLLRFVPCTA